jgi:hypothetical protein
MQTRVLAAHGVFNQDFIADFVQIDRTVPLDQDILAAAPSSI